MAKALPRGVREKNGSYEARAVVNGIRINLYGTDLNELMEEFEKAKENARDTLDYRKTRITLNEWFEEWFSEVKQHRVKETSIAPMKNNFKRMREKEGVLAVQENREPREIRDFHPHSLRHTFATRCFEKKMEPKVVQRLMGHSSISITLNIYTHVLDNIMEEEIKKFGVAKTQTPEEYYNEEIRKVRISAMSHC